MTPRVNIDLTGITANARKMKNKCDQENIKLTGVVKGSAGDVRVARAFISGGIDSIADSRLRNIKILREAGFEKEEMVLLRLPQLSKVGEVVKYADVSLVSELKTIKALSEAAVAQNKIHEIIIMVDVGDLREGVMPEDLSDFIAVIIDLEGVRINGLGTNVGCYGGVLPTPENTRKLVELKEKLLLEYDINLSVISGGNTATTKLLDEGMLPAGVNNFRVGEAILQGTDITHQRKISGLKKDNFTLTASVIELKKKPSVPEGEIGHDAFGGKPQFEDKGIRKRAILAIGRQDVKVDGLTPLISGAEIIGASSDHLLLDVTEVEKDLTIGDKIDFSLDYGAMLALMTSPYVEKKYLE
ncbi:MAG: alanine/ornithine racemase family PLP-dependent enzyme [Bacillota bacterium]